MKTIVYALVAGLAAVSAAVAVQFRQMDKARDDAVQQVCVRISRLDNTLIDLIKTGEESTPKLAYYRAHPDELRLVIQQDEEAIRKLAPPKFCD